MKQSYRMIRSCRSHLKIPPVISPCSREHLSASLAKVGGETQAKPDIFWASALSHSFRSSW